MFFKRRRRKNNLLAQVQAAIPGSVNVWEEISTNIKKAPWDVTVLPVEATRSNQIMSELELTQDSEFGALISNTGGLIVAHGWVKILAGGHPGLPDVAQASPFTREDPHYMVLAVDVIGGIFAIDGHALGIGAGRICYFDPVALEFQDLRVDHTTFMKWILSGDVDTFYSRYRWDTWQQDIAELGLNEGLTIVTSTEDIKPRNVGLPLAEIWEQLFSRAELDIRRPAGF